MTDFEKIIGVVEKEADAIDHLLNAMIKKQEFIISMTIDNLQSVINEEIKLVSLTKSLENERLGLLKELLPESKNAMDVTMTEMIEKAPAEESKILERLKIRLQNSLDEMKHVNEVNRLLLERSKKFIKDNISIITCCGEKQLVNTKV